MQATARRVVSSHAAHEVERPMWGPNPEPLRAFVEDHFWFLGNRFLTAFGSLVMGKQVTIAKAEGAPKPPGWGEVMKLFQAGGDPQVQMQGWTSLIDSFAQALLPVHSIQDASQVWALRSALLTQIQERVKAITTPGAWDKYFHVMPESQKYIAEWTALRGAAFVTKMSKNARQAVLDCLIDAKLGKEGRGNLEVKLREKLGVLNRDWRRIAITETAMAISNGQLASVADSGEWEAVWVAGPNACPFCRKMFGRVFWVVPRFKVGMNPQDVIWPGKHNVGRSPSLYRKDGTMRTPAELWWPCIPAHPNCMCLWSLRRRLKTSAAKQAEGILSGLRKARFDRYSKV
jgi:hypothetical protein